MTAGVPQGSILGPTLWNLAYDSVLLMPDLPRGARLVAYADDLAVVVTAREEAALECRTNEALEMVDEWMRDHKLTLAPHKSEAVLLIGKKRPKEINITLGDHSIEIKKEVKYLGVVLDRPRTGTAHVNYATSKAMNTCRKLSRIMPRRGGATEAKRRLLASAATSAVLYGAPTWAEKALSSKRNREKLASTQRIIALRVARAYRTVSSKAALVLSGLIPWELLAEERTKRYKDDSSDETDLREKTMVSWQAAWDKEEGGNTTRWTKRLIPNLKAWVSRTHGDTSYYLTQILSGHGSFQTYMVKIGKTQVATCVLCDSGEEDDVTHTVLRCEKLKEIRERAAALMEDQQTVEKIIQRMLGSDQEWQTIAEALENIMRKKDELEQERRERVRRRVAT